MANNGSFKKGEKRPKQGKRGPGKATLAVREAIAKLADGHAAKFIGWVDRVAKDDPKGAAELYLKAIEYHIPKLARTELTGKDGGPVVVAASASDERL